MPFAQGIPYLAECLSVGAIAVFMAVSPGPDFVMVTRNSLLYSRKSGLYSALGVGVAIWVHVTYSIAGLAILISKSIVLFSILKYLGAAYLIYTGWKTFTSKPGESTDTVSSSSQLGNGASFKVGFITNALNPKTSIFFLSLFTQIVSPQTPLAVLVVYGAIISVVHMLWFCAVATFFTHPAFLARFNSVKGLIEKCVGALLIGLGVKVATSS